jgi:hypothetical protein
MRNEDGSIDESNLKKLGERQGELMKSGSLLMKNHRTESDDQFYTRGMIEGFVGAMAKVMGSLADSVEGDISSIKGPLRDE